VDELCGRPTIALGVLVAGALAGTATTGAAAGAAATGLDVATAAATTFAGFSSGAGGGGPFGCRGSLRWCFGLGRSRWRAAGDAPRRGSADA
jgi:hypothetical protein